MASSDGDNLLLAEPRKELREEYMDFYREFARAGEEDIHGKGAKFTGRDDEFDDFVDRLLGFARGEGLREGWVPGSTWWLMRGRRVIGTVNLRHALNESLRDYGGHIGYSIRPCERGKGLATRMLALTLDKARELGLARVLLTCDVGNVASARVMEKNGGVLASESYSPRAEGVQRRYWIELGD